jgi:hypothetical protein
MDPIVWLDGAKPANTSTPPSLPLEHRCAACSPLKNTYGSNNKSAKFSEISILPLENHKRL